VVERVCCHSDSSAVFAYPPTPELGRTPGGVAASTGLGGGRGHVLRPRSSVNDALEAPRLAPGVSQDKPWSKQTPGAQGTESPPMESAGDPFTCSNGCESPECDETGELLPKGLYSSENAALNRKRRRFSVRCHRGIACGIAKGKRFRVFCLTESDEALRAELGPGFDTLAVMLSTFGSSIVRVNRAKSPVSDVAIYMCLAMGRTSCRCWI
jgi:hypothetical protein